MSSHWLWCEIIDKVRGIIIVIRIRFKTRGSISFGKDSELSPLTYLCSSNGIVSTPSVTKPHCKLSFTFLTICHKSQRCSYIVTFKCLFVITTTK